MRNTIGNLLLCAACCLGCNAAEPPTFPDPGIVRPEIERLQVFVRDWPTEYAELDLVRKGDESTVVLFIPAGDGRARVVLDSVGPSPNDAPEVAELLKTFDVWTLAAPDAPGAACSNLKGQWTCYPTFEDYSLVMRVISGGVTRNQRYTLLDESGAHVSARALGDLILTWARTRAAGAQ